MVRPVVFLLFVIGCGDDPAESVCASETRGDVLRVGDNAEADGVTAEVVRMDPERAEVGLNTWTVRLDGGDEGCTLEVLPLMPDHGHGSAVGPVSSLGGGEWLIEDLRISMGGYWQIGLVRTCGEQSTTVTLDLCVDA